MSAYQNVSDRWGEEPTFSQKWEESWEIRMSIKFSHFGKYYEEDLKKILFDICRRPKYVSQVEDVREKAREEVRLGQGDEKSNLAKKKLPLFWPSGVVEKDGNGLRLVEFSGLMQIDIDQKDNPGISTDRMKKILSKFPSVLYASVSSRGRGCFALVRVPRVCDPLKFRGHHRAFSRFLEEEHRLVVDPDCKSMTQARFISYDEKPYWNERAEPFVLCDIEERKVTEHPKKDYTTTASGYMDNRDFNFARVKNIIDLADSQNIAIVDGGKSSWFSVGQALASTFGDDGRTLFLSLSDTWERCRGKQQIDPEEAYEWCLKHPKNDIGYLFEIAKNMGVMAENPVG